MSATYCRRGHEYAVVGRDKSGWCSECRRENDRGTRPQVHRSPFCLRGHDTRIVGRRPNGRCRVCDNAGRSYKGYEEGLVGKERLPVGPLASRLCRVELRHALSETNERLFYRARERGWISVMVADEICFEALGKHPFDVWGPDWFDPPTIPDATEEAA